MLVIEDAPFGGFKGTPTGNQPFTGVSCFEAHPNTKQSQSRGFAKPARDLGGLALDSWGPRPAATALMRAFARCMSANEKLRERAM